MHVVVASVPHTGTRFVFEHLLAGRHRCDHDPCDDGFTVLHTEKRHMASLVPLAEEHTTIVPLRHPKTVARSWLSRQDNNPDYYDLNHLAEQFRYLVTDIDPLGPHYLPIDSADRDTYLGDLNRNTGLNLSTDWRTVGANGESAELSDAGIVEGLMQEHSAFFARFGYVWE